MNLWLVLGQRRDDAADVADVSRQDGLSDPDRNTHEVLHGRTSAVPDRAEIDPDDTTVIERINRDRRRPARPVVPAEIHRAAPLHYARLG